MLKGSFRVVSVGVALAVVSASLVSGCERDKPAPIRAVTLEPTKAPEIVAPGTEQQKRFVDAVFETARRGDAASFNELIDWDALCRRAARDLYASEQILTGVATGAREGCKKTGVCAALASVGQGQAKLRYLGPQAIAGESWITFRRMPNEGGFDHISFLLTKTTQGKARAIDVLMLSLGETSSSAMRRGLLPMLAVDGERSVRRMQGTESAFAKHGAEIARAQELASQGKAGEALAILDALPATLRGDRFIQTQRVNITRATGDEPTYLAAIQELATRYPNDPATVMHLLDAYVLRGRYAEALEALKRIEALTVADPYLDVLRANLLVSAGLAIDGAAAARVALQREPDLIEAHWALVAATLKQPDFAATSAALLAIHRQFAIPIQLDGIPDYAAYAASPEYANLKQQLASP